MGMSTVWRKKFKSALTKLSPGLLHGIRVSWAILSFVKVIHRLAVTENKFFKGKQRMKWLLAGMGAEAAHRSETLTEL